jgi:plastocyanin
MSPIVKHTLRGVTIVVAASVLAGCADDGPRPVVAGQPAVPTATVDDTSAPVQTVTVQAIDNTFRPDRIEIAPGTEVVWVNRGRNDHDLMTDFGFGVTAADFGPGAEYRHVFTEPGEYPYYCTIHGTPDIGMIGTVVVTDTG